MPSLAAVLKAEADRQQLSQTQLADRAGLAQTSVSEFLTGKKIPSADSLSGLLAALGRTWGWLDRQGLKPRKRGTS